MQVKNLVLSREPERSSKGLYLRIADLNAGKIDSDGVYGFLLLGPCLSFIVHLLRPCAWESKPKSLSSATDLFSFFLLGSSENYY